MADKIDAKVHVLQHGNEQVTSYYGSRTDPVTGKKSSYHYGIDLINNVGGERIVAFAAGTVTATRNSYSGPTTDGSAGNYIRIQHADGKYTLYKHLKQNTLKVKKGQAVKAGQVLATMGNTGHSTGIHLHFDVEIDGKRVDPLPYLLGKKELIPTPVPETSEVVYTVVKGDNLSKIAAKYDTTWQKLAEYNNLDDPNLIRVGQKIKIPVTTVKGEKAPRIHIVTKGESLYRIGKKYDVAWKNIAKTNGIKFPYIIHVGDVLKIPDK